MESMLWNDAFTLKTSTLKPQVGNFVRGILGVWRPSDREQNFDLTLYLVTMTTKKNTSFFICNSLIICNKYDRIQF
jgi:hypothetical protein